MVPRLPVYYRYEPIDLVDEQRRDGSPSDNPEQTKLRTLDGRYIFLDLEYGKGVEIHDSITLNRPELYNTFVNTPSKESSQAEEVLPKERRKTRPRKLVMAKNGDMLLRPTLVKRTTPESSPSSVNGGSSTKRRKLRYSQALEGGEGEDMVPETSTRTESKDQDMQPTAAEKVNTSDSAVNMVTESHISLESVNSNDSDVQMEGSGIKADDRVIPDSQGNDALNTVRSMQMEERIDTTGITSLVSRDDAQTEPDVEPTELTKQCTPSRPLSDKSTQKKLEISALAPSWEHENPQEGGKKGSMAENVFNKHTPVSWKSAAANTLARRLEEVEDSENEPVAKSVSTPLNVRKSSKTSTLPKDLELLPVFPAKSVGRVASPEIETAADREYEQPTLQLDEPEGTESDEIPHEKSSENDCWYCHARTTKLFTKTAGGQSFRFCTECHEQLESDRAFAKEVRHLAWKELGDASIPKYPFFDKEASVSTSIEPTKASAAPSPAPTNVNPVEPSCPPIEADDTRQRSHPNKTPSEEQQRQYQLLQQQLQQLRQAQQQKQQAQHEHIPQNNWEQLAQKLPQQSMSTPGPQSSSTLSSDSANGPMEQRVLKTFRLFRYDVPERYLMLTELDIADKRSRSKFSMIKLRKLAWKNFMYDSDREQFWFNYVQILEGRDDLNKYARRAPGGGGDITIVPLLPGGRLPDLFLEEQARRRWQFEQLTQMHGMKFQGPVIMTPNGPMPIIYPGHMPPGMLAAMSSNGFTNVLPSSSQASTRPIIPNTCLTTSSTVMPDVAITVRPAVSVDESSNNNLVEGSQTPSQANAVSSGNPKAAVSSCTTQIMDRPEEAPQTNGTEGRASVERDVDILLRAAGVPVEHDGVTAVTTAREETTVSIAVGRVPAKMRSKSYAALKQTIQSTTPRPPQPLKAVDPSTLPRPLPYRKPVGARPTITVAGASSTTSTPTPSPSTVPSNVSAISPPDVHTSPVQMPPAFRPAINNREKATRGLDSIIPQQTSDIANSIANALGSVGFTSLDQRTSEEKKKDKHAETPDETVMRRFSYVQNSQRAARAQGVYPHFTTPSKPISTITTPNPVPTASTISSNLRKVNADSTHASIIAALQFGNPKASKPKVPPSPPCFLSSAHPSASSTPPASPENTLPLKPIDKSSFDEVIEICARKLNETANIGKPLRLMLTNPEKSSGPPPAMGGILSFEQNVGLAKLLHRVCTKPDDTLKDRPDLLAFTDIAAKMRNIPKDYGPYIAASPSI